MARLCWNFNTNVKKKDPDMFTPQLDELIFITEYDEYLYISGKESSFGLDDGVHSGEWKGLKYRLEDSEGRALMDNWCEEDNTREFEKLLSRAAFPVAFLVDEYDLSEHGYDYNFTPTCENVDIDIEIAGVNFSVNFSFSADSLMEEGQWFKKIGVR